MLALISGGLWLFFVFPNSRFVFYRYIGDYRFGIQIGSEIDIDGTESKLLVTSYYDPPMLMYHVGKFKIPDQQSPDFSTILDETSGLFCVYDNNDWDYIAIVNTATNEWMSSERFANFHVNVPEWVDDFRLLKQNHPEIPYEHVFGIED